MGSAESSDLQQMLKITSESLRITLAAGSYLLDMVTTGATLAEYYTYHNSLLKRNFYNLLVILLVAYAVSLVVFKLKVPAHKHPIRSSLFLPLMQLWDMIIKLRSKLSHSLNILDDRSTLFSILSLTLKTSPTLQLQHDAIYKKRLSNDQDIPPRLFVFIFGTLISGGINGSLSVLSKASNANSVRKRISMAVLAGSYIASAILLRSISCAIFAITKAKFFPFMTSVFAVHLLIHWLLLWFLLPHDPAVSMFSWRKAAHVFLYALMSSFTCPLYILVSEHREHKQLGTSKYRCKVVIMATAQLLTDVVAWTLLILRPPEPDVVNMLFYIQLEVSQAVYLLSTVGIVLLDYACGTEGNLPT